MRVTIVHLPFSRANSIILQPKCSLTAAIHPFGRNSLSVVHYFGDLKSLVSKTSENLRSWPKVKKENTICHSGKVGLNL